MQNCIKISSRQKTLAIERKPAAKCKSMNSGKSHIRQHPSNFPCRHFWYFFPLSGKNPSEAQNPWDPGPLRVWGFPTEQLWAVHHQLRQREAPAGVHRDVLQGGAGGVSVGGGGVEPGWVLQQLCDLPADRTVQLRRVQSLWWVLSQTAWLGRPNLGSEFSHGAELQTKFPPPLRVKHTRKWRGEKCGEPRTCWLF